MTQANVLLALEELQSEYASAINDMDQKRRELSTLEDRSHRLRDAIESLKRLVSPDSDSESESVSEPESEASSVPNANTDADDTKTEAELDDVVPDGPLVPPDSPIAKYIKRGGEGRRLSSTTMVVDVVEKLDKAVTRGDLKDAFFETFSREEMGRFWDRIDNAFGTALARAVKDKLIVRGQRSNGTEVYGSLALAERLRQKKQTASSGTEAEEE